VVTAQEQAEGAQPLCQSPLPHGSRSLEQKLVPSRLGALAEELSKTLLIYNVSKGTHLALMING